MKVQEVILMALSGELHWFRAADILGFGRDHVRVIACDERQRMRVDLLAPRIEATPFSSVV